MVRERIKQVVKSKSYGDNIYFEWIDAYTKDGWIHISEAVRTDNRAMCFTNAKYLKHDETWLIVAHTLGEEGKNNTMGVLAVPICCIRKVK